MKKKEINRLIDSLNAVPKIIYESILYGSWDKGFLVPYIQEETEINGVKSISKERLDEFAITITEEECAYGISNLIDYIEKEIEKVVKEKANIEGFMLRIDKR